MGISAFYHDSAAALLRDGEIVAAAQEERFTREKNDKSFPYKISHPDLTLDGKRLFGVINPSTIAVVTKKPRILHVLRGNAGLADFAINSDGVMLVAGLGGGLVRLWDTKTGKPTRYLQAHDKDISSLVFTIDGRRMITTSAVKTMRFFDFPIASRMFIVRDRV